MATDAEILAAEFEHELCPNCGGDASEHVVTHGPFDEPHIVCKSEL